jgi:hypothetical protein
MAQQFDPDRLRPAEFVSEPDPRSLMFAKVDLTNGTSRQINLADHHEGISMCALHAGVPGDIVIQFETARNLYLYSWFVYRFYPVADQQSLACLELALRQRLHEEIKTGKITAGNTKRKPTLYPLLQYAIANGIVKNEGFSTWRNRGEINSRHRVEMEKIREATEKKLDKITWDESDIQITAEDLEWDYVKMLGDILPLFRNNHAHGTTDLLNGALLTIRIVSEIINQLYEAPAL